MSEIYIDQWVQYNKATGEIVGSITATNDAIGWQGNAYGFIKHVGSVSEKTQYVDLLDLHVKNKEDYAYSNIPLPCEMYIDGIKYNVSTTPSITFEEDGIYDVGVKPISVTNICKIFKISQVSGVITELSEEVISANFPL